MEKRVVSRVFTFDAAHRITSHPGKCRSLHGHTWRVEIRVEGGVDPKTGMVMDFFYLGRIGKTLFDATWDHSAILAEWDPLVVVCREIRSRLVLVKQEPTSETLAGLIRDHFQEYLPPGVRLVSVRLWETPNCSAEVVSEG